MMGKAGSLRETEHTALSQWVLKLEFGVPEQKGETNDQGGNPLSSGDRRVLSFPCFSSPVSSLQPLLYHLSAHSFTVRHSLYAKYCARHFIYIFSFNLHRNPVRMELLLHSTIGKLKARKVKVTQLVHSTLYLKAYALSTTCKSYEISQR